MPFFIPLRIQPGVFRNGTKYQAKQRWYDANLIRWIEGAMQPVGGWSKVYESSPTYQKINLAEPVRGMLGWKDNNRKPRLAMGTPTKAYGFVEGVLTDITPAGFTTGGADAAQASGQYGNGNYGEFNYGEGDPYQQTIVEANSWAFDAWGQYLIGWAYSDGKIYEYQLSGDLTVIANAPTNVRGGVVVTPERFLFALGASGDGRNVAWCDQEDNTLWTPASDNQAGDFPLSTNGELMCGLAGRNETLLWTDVDLWVARYIGGTLVYQFSRAGHGGVISRRAAAVVDGRAFWMGNKCFYQYDGFVTKISCDISDYVFSDLNRTQRSKIKAVPLPEVGEIWFCYPSGNSTENDRIAIYNYNEGWWSIASLERTDGIGRSVFEYPIMADASGGIYDHERGTSYLDTDDSTPLVIDAETGPFEIARGDQVLTILGVEPDEKTLGQVTGVLYASLHPTATETSQAITFSEPTDARLTGRQVRLKITQASVNWRWGIPRLLVERGGRR